MHDHVVTTVTGGPITPPAADSEFTYVWFDGAEESTEQYQPDATDDWESLLIYDQRQDLVEANIHEGNPQIVSDAVWRSGITGVSVRFAKDQVLNKMSVKKSLSEILGVEDWTEVEGPDSLQLK